MLLSLGFKQTLNATSDIKTTDENKKLLKEVGGEDVEPISYENQGDENHLNKRQLSLADLPPCGQTCYVGSLTVSGGCSITDFPCLCQSKSFMTQAQECFKQKCSQSELSTVLSLSLQTCQVLNIPFYRIPEFQLSSIIVTATLVNDGRINGIPLSIPTGTSNSSSTSKGSNNDTVS
ncbi:hypothetical protein BY996DRAFT_6414940 [Phakopsora pachyrhizi]|nr:hypothetical protein BY996DRAFT_6414940 [Phakopsora pachyrhizi]